MSIKRAFSEQSIFRSIAIILILNSHLDGFWRSNFLASGGSLGNTMFFFISGISLINQINLKTLNEIFSINIINWAKKRLIRIYIPLWYYLIIFSALTLILPTNLYTYKINFNLNNFFYPTDYWFISELLILYFITPFIDLLIKKGFSKTLFIVIFTIYLAYYINLIYANQATGLFVESTGLRYLFYGFIYIFSLKLLMLYQNFKKNISLYLSKIEIFSYSTLILSLILLIFYRLNINNDNYNLIQILFHILQTIICLAIYDICLNLKIYLDKNHKIFKKLFMEISILTFDLYLFEHYTINIVNRFREDYLDIYIDNFSLLKYIYLIIIPIYMLFSYFLCKLLMNMRLAISFNFIKLINNFPKV